MKLHAFIFLSLALLLSASAQQCGRQANSAVCQNGLCCSEHGWCGTTDAYCGAGCQSQCRRPGPTPTLPPNAGSGVGRIITAAVFDQLLKYRNDPRCRSNGFYTYNAFLTAARSFPAFGTTGDDATRRRELAAFLAQTSHETTGGWPTAPDGPYAWGYCFVRELRQDAYCRSPDPEWPCAPGQKYFGRGPIQLTHNYNYGQAGRALDLNLLNNPDLVATDPIVSFRTAIWFWMTPQGNKPSSHDVIIGRWQPSNVDRAAGRAAGYGVITNIINGEFECGSGPNDRATSRIGFYTSYCNLLGVTMGPNLDCNNQRPFGSR
ncbi:endochitinase-like [Cucurbita maxima]|uniref:chitinase n=1 Tax=Cucurbita maxima TaxID=3661 RepID=A0A6J1KUS6_CUCMA|nr:endochitinase-like [Cucurbita maxima]